MKRNNRYLYESIMRSVSKQVKRTLNEDIQQFDTTEYNESESVDFQDIRDITKTKNADKSIFDWLSDAMEYIANNHSEREEEEYGRDVLYSIYHDINGNVQKILAYDEFTLGEILKNAIKKGLEPKIDEEEIEDIKENFESWVERNFLIIYPSDIDEEDDDIKLDEYLDYLKDMRNEISSQISDFLDGHDISNKYAKVLMHKTSNYPTFDEWLNEYFKEFYDEYNEIQNK